MDTFDDAVAQLTGAQAGGFAFRPEQSTSLINEGIKRLAESSEWIRAELEIGTTLVGEDLYDLPDNIVRMQEVLINGLRYLLVNRDDILGLEAGRLQVVEYPDVGGVFCERFSSDGQKRISIYPPPEEAGLPIIAEAAIYPDKTLGGADPLPFPPRFRRAIVDYAKGIAYEDMDENPQAGAGYLARADQRGEELRLLGKSRAQSNAPYKIPVAGHR